MSEPEEPPSQRLDHPLAEQGPEWQKRSALPRVARSAYAHMPRPVRTNVLMRGLSVLARGAWREPRWFAVAMVGGVAFALLQVATASAMGWLTAEVIYPAFEGPVWRTIAVGGVVLAALGLARAVAVALRRLGSGFLQFNLVAGLRHRMVERTAVLPMAWHRREGAGQLLSRAVSDAEITWLSMGAFPFAASTVVMLVVGLASIFLLDVWLGVVAAVIPAILAVNWWYQYLITPSVVEAQHVRAKTTGVAHESLEGGELVKVMGREREESERFSRAAQRLARANIRVGIIRSWFDPVLEALPTVGALAVILVGALRVSSGGVGAGDIVQASYLFGIMAVPLQAIGFVLSSLAEAVVGHDRVGKVLLARSDMRYGSRKVPSDPESAAQLRMDQISYEYPDGRGSMHRGAALQEVSLDIDDARGARIVAVVGKTGSGKSTLTYVASRLVDPTDGSVSIDGVDVTDFAEQELGSDVALVLQEPFIFDLSVRDNVLLGYRASDDEVWHALEVAQAAGFVRARQEGLDTRLGERGGRLSGGQRQRIALARALVRRPRVLVLDDATSAVDPLVEAAIIEGLRRHVVYSSVLMVAYRKSAIALADEVVFVDGGRVAGRGTHEELLTGLEAYRELVNAYDAAAVADELIEGGRDANGE